MKGSWNYQVGRMMLPGLKRWILFIVFGIISIVLGVFLLLGFHPITVAGSFLRDVMEHAVDVLPHRISGLIVIALGGGIVCLAVAKLTIEVLGAYIPYERDSIPDVLYRRRKLDRGPRVVVIGGGTGLSNLLRGLKLFTNNITAIVTVGDDGGSSGRLRQEFGCLPPGDIRNCITALADEDKLVTELFRYRFGAGTELEGHSFGNLFLTALWSITDGDILEAARVASRVLNSCGQVLPSTLANITLEAELEDGSIIKGESMIAQAQCRIKAVQLEPRLPRATPEAIAEILNADLIVLGPGSLYTSIIPNLLVQGITEAIRRSRAAKIYVCNVMTQPGETTGYTVSDHAAAILGHCGGVPGIRQSFLDAVLVNDEMPLPDKETGCTPVRYDPERLRELGLRSVLRSLLSRQTQWHHDANRLAKALLLWYLRQKRRKRLFPAPSLASQRYASFF